MLSQSLFDALHALGTRAPVVLLPDGGDHSYWHNRADGTWGSMVLDEIVAESTAASRSAGSRWAATARSSSALDAHFCAVGGHSPALWFSGADSAAGAFDDAEDYARHDIVNHPPHYSAPVWIDVGTERSVPQRGRPLRARDPCAAARLAGRARQRLLALAHARSTLRSMPGTAPEPKIELHVHLEGTVRPDTLRAIAKRNDYALPDDLESLYRFRDFAHFIEVWILTTERAPHCDDFRQVVTDYAGEAAAHGAVYLEAIFSPAERVARGRRLGRDLQRLLRRRRAGTRAARRRGAAHARHLPRSDRGAGRAGGALFGQVPRAGSRRRRARRPGGGVPAGAVRAGVRARASRSASPRCPHAGEVAGPASVRGALEALGADRIRHGIRCRRGLRPRRRARRSRHRPRRLPALEPPHRRRPRRSRSTRCRSSSPPVSAARSRPTTRRCSRPT